MGKFIIFGNKKLQYYNGILIKADLGLHEQLEKKLTEVLPNNSEVLDVGAGEGALSERLSDAGFNVTALDINAEDFKSKKAKFCQINFNNENELDNFSIQYNEKFDAVIGVEVIEHIENPWKYISFMKKMIKPGGILLITTPNITSWLSRMIFLFEGKFHQFSDGDLSYGHISPISSWELKVVLEKSGFIKVEIEPAGTLPFLWIVKDKRLLFYNFVSLVFRPFMRNIKKGWVIMCTARKTIKE